MMRKPWNGIDGALQPGRANRSTISLVETCLAEAAEKKKFSASCSPLMNQLKP